jgi:citrate lyase subunit beta/citryl-CoA lyase
MAKEKPRRSALYTPGAKEAVLVKAFDSAADVLIFDLEDAVSPDAKSQARATVAGVLHARQTDDREIVVRVNGLDTAWCEDDVLAIAPLGVSAILFPKISSASDAEKAQALLDKHGAPAHTRLWCMVETALGVLNAQSIGQLARQPGSRMDGWVIGTNDLLKELRAASMPAREPLLPALGIAMLAARAYGLFILDGVYNDIQDSEGFEESCRQGLALGFDGKTVIHPVQIAAANKIFSPSEHAVQEARAIVDAFALPENAGKGVIKVNGRMTELLHAEMAQRTLDIAEAIAHSGRV